MRPNIKLDKSLKVKLDARILNAADYFILALADQLAGLFPTAVVYTCAQQQGAKLPACFISIYHATAQGALGGAFALEFETEVTYITADALARDEQLSAAVAMLEMPAELPSDIGVFVLKGRGVSNNDGMVQLLCRTEAVLKSPNTDDLMQNLEQGVNV
ncbi:MAG: hypothetical protein VB035_00775 [Candidatus Fimivivens sp.]|nr:hypothetical protein [Candidatus Fimivivens sp.]